MPRDRVHLPLFLLMIVLWPLCGKPRMRLCVDCILCGFRALGAGFACFPKTGAKDVVHAHCELTSVARRRSFFVEKRWSYIKIIRFSAVHDVTQILDAHLMLNSPHVDLGAYHTCLFDAGVQYLMSRSSRIRLSPESYPEMGY
jgi:hypothetical protein